MTPQFCPECNKEMHVLSPTPNYHNNTSNITNFTVNTGGETLNLPFDSTSVQFKCVSPGCWVTKVNVSWS